MLHLIRFLFGYVIFSVSGPFPERFINLCAHYGVSLWNIKRNKNVMICFSMASEYKTLRAIAKKSSMKIKLNKKEGLPFILKKYKKRKGILLGIILFFIIIHIFSLYIWNIDINGNNTLSKDEIFSTLNELKVSRGIFKNKIDLSAIESTLMTKYNNISWTSANIIGCNLEIEIKEKVTPPEITSNNTPCNIKASCDAYITRLEVYNGTAEVKPGDSVTAGQLLVNGIFEDNFGQSSFHHASAKIFAVTNKAFIEEVDLNPSEHLYTGKIINRKKARLFNLEIPITFKPIPKGNFEKNVEIKDITIFKKPIPLTLYKEKWSHFKEKTKSISKSEAINIAKKNMEDKENNELKNLKILKKDSKEKFFNGKYILTVNYTCEENIALEEAILFE